MPDKTKLDSLRIDRESKSTSKRTGLFSRILLGMVLITALYFGWRWFQRDQTLRVVTEPVREISLGEQQRTVLNASGYVVARRKATVSAKITGKVIEVHIEEGMEVERGQILARFEQSNVRAALDLARAQAAAARLSIQETEIRIAEAGRQLKRTRSLVADGIWTQADLDRDQSEHDALEARLDAQSAEAEAADRRVAEVSQELEDTVIRAPFTGVIISKDAQPGEMISPVSAGGGFTRTGIGTVVDMKSLEIEVDVNEAYINRVKADQPVDAVLDAYPDWQIPAKVIAIVPTADRQRATVRVRIGFDALDPRVLPDMGVKVAFQEGEVPETRQALSGLVVPIKAVRREGNRGRVFVVSDGRVARRWIELGETLGSNVRVITGLEPGERVVIEGLDELQDGDQVQEASR